MPHPRALLAALCITLVLAAVPALAQGPSETAQYTVRFDATWSAATHPVEFPPQPHFSALIGATHQADLRFWEPGTNASHGIKNMAERGRTRPLAAEVETAIAAGTANQVLQGGGIFPSPDFLDLSFTMDRDFPAVTLVTMVAPSPDWFVGVSALPLFEDGGWVQERVVELFAYDAGTDSGTTFLSPDLATMPPVPVHRIQGGSLGNGVPLGTFTFTRTDSDPPEPLALRSGRFLVSVEWETQDGTRGYGQGSALSGDSGIFWFFNPANVEMLIKVLDGCAAFNHYWVFAAGLTNVGVEISVTDTTTGAVKSYDNPLGIPFEPIQDTRAFATCP
jgi:hypothetical protein